MNAIANIFKGSIGFVLKCFLIFALYKFSSEIWNPLAHLFGIKKGLIPPFLFFLIAATCVLFGGFVWHRIVKPFLVFCFLAPTIYMGLTYLAHFFVNKQGMHQPMMVWTLRAMSISLGFYFSTIGFKLIKMAAWKILWVLFSPIRFVNQKIIQPVWNKIVQKFRYGNKVCPINIPIHKIDAFGNGDTYDKGRIFEEYVAEIYRTLGYDAKTTTQLRKEGKLPPSIQKRGGSGEQGVDVIVRIPQENGFIMIVAIQCKHYSKPVSNSAIQEIYGSLTLYGAHKGVVITNNRFTEPAIELAAVNQIMLIDRQKLQELVQNTTKFYYEKQKNSGYEEKKIVADFKKSA